MISQSIINKLKEKGVAADIILDLILDDEQAPEETPAPQQEETPALEVPAAPQQEETPAAAPQQDAILAAINKLTGAIQASNILNSGSKGPETETSADALAQIINPKGGINYGSK